MIRRCFPVARLLARLAVVLAVIQFGVLMPAAMAAPLSHDISGLVCGEGAPSPEARRALEDLAQALGLDGFEERDHEGACHSCPVGCAGAVAPGPLHHAQDVAFGAPVSDRERAARRLVVSTASGPPVGGRAPPARISQPTSHT